MQEGRPALQKGDLLARGFTSACVWQNDAGCLRRSATVPDRPGVYAFCRDAEVLYVGLAWKSLARRLYGYEKPGPSQKTNRRLNELLLASASAGNNVEVLIASPPNFDWNGWSISGAEGLEAGLIRDFNLPWNVRGGVIEAANPDRVVAPDTELSQTSVPTRHGGKYGPLRTYLEDCQRDRVTLTLRQIEELVGKLPKSASLHLAWWGNHEGNTQAKAWMGARYLVEANPPGRSVTFRKFEY